MTFPFSIFVSLLKTVTWELCGCRPENRRLSLCLAAAPVARAVRSSPLHFRRRGFTFIELLATLVLIGLVMPVAMHTVGLCTSLSGQARRRVEAATLARSKLCELIVADLWQSGSQSGDFGDDWPGYRWTAAQGAWSDPVVSQLDVTVTWKERNRERSVTLSTLVCPEDE
ncbi:MAG TPA: type II secretion system protein [Anaerohalosphaeraceae bacterium]|nr:type II secretion system protein [Anaerohalosphaeraceae bacterium]HRT49097.1 type II secretion system protein [Anaerohalosphaeraceae bacterium]HRT85650.1 type II secretion system protein [Anaerohalosphaeraceae bacterium]